MWAERSTRAWWISALALVVLASAPSTAAGQFTVAEIAVPTGTNTYNFAIPPIVQLPPPPPSFLNPLGLTPGFYSINLGRCLGEFSSSTCSGAFLTHAAPSGSTDGVPVASNPAASVGDVFGSFLGGSAEDDAPAVSASTTMPGWSLFTMNFGTAQQALSVADFTTTIEMPRSQHFIGGNWLLSDWRSHSFSRSQDYNELRVAFPFLVDGNLNPPSRRLLSLELRGENASAVSWETSFISGSSLLWTTGFGAVMADDLLFGFGDPAPMTESEKLNRLLGSISRHLLIDEPEKARQVWLGFNPLGMVSHTDWRRIANEIERELPDLQEGKRSNILNPDGTFTMPVRADLDEFLLPEPRAVPEPSTLALLGLGLTVLGLSRRRR